MKKSFACVVFLLGCVCAFGQSYSFDRKFNGVHYLTLDSMCEANNPNPGNYLIRLNIDKDGGIDYEKVRMNYTPPKKKK